MTRKDPQHTRRRWVLTRRRFLGNATTGVVAATALAGCTADESDRGVGGPRSDLERPYTDVPGMPAEVPQPAQLRWLRPEEAETLDVLVATILPGSPEDPGAREAGVVTYVDTKLASTPSGLPDRHNSRPPFATAVPAGEPVPESTEAQVYVPEDELDRYGPQSSLDRREQYRSGLAALDRAARSRFGVPFTGLDPIQLDGLVESLANDAVDEFTEPGAQEFFNIVRGDVVEGMFCDPSYGGNRGMSGWKLVGYPGAQRGYTVDDVQGRAPERPVQSMADLPHFHPGQKDGPNVMLPVSGSRDGHETSDDQGR